MKNFFDRLPWQIIFVIILAIFFLRNLLIPKVADDYSYAFIWDGDGYGNLFDNIDPSRLHRIESVSDIFHSQVSHYFTWGGRSVAHSIVQFFVWQGKFFFDVANVFVFAALILLIFKLGTGLSLRSLNKTYLLFIVAGIHFCAPSLLICTLWMTGTCNYLWMCTLELVFLLIIINKKSNIPLYTFIIAFLAGWSIEAGAAATIFVTALFLWQFKSEKNLCSRMLVSFGFLIFGFTLLMLALGNFNRADLVNATLSLQKNFAEGLLPIFTREAILFAPIIFYFIKLRTSPSVTKFIVIFSAASILTLLVMMFAPIFPERAGFPSTIFLLIASLAAFKEILPHIKKVLVGVVAVSLSLSLIGCIYVESSFRLQMIERFKMIELHRNDDLIIIPPIILPSWPESLLGQRTWDQFALNAGADLSFLESNNRNITFCRFHGLKKIVIENIQ